MWTPWSPEYALLECLGRLSAVQGILWYLTVDVVILVLFLLSPTKVPTWLKWCAISILLVLLLCFWIFLWGEIVVPLEMMNSLSGTPQ